MPVDGWRNIIHRTMTIQKGPHDLRSNCEIFTIVIRIFLSFFFFKDRLIERLREIERERLKEKDGEKD